MAERRRVIVIGAGGHARVCLDALADDSANQVIGCVSSDGTGVAGLPVPVLGRTTDLRALADDLGCTHGFVAVGDNAVRRRLMGDVRDAGLVPVVAVSRFAMVSPAATIGAFCLVVAGAVVNAAAVLSEGVIVNSAASVDHDCRIGIASHLAPGAVLGGEVVVGDGVLVGLGSRVLPRLTVGDGAVVGAGAVVVRDVSPGTVVVGVPARARGQA